MNLHGIVRDAINAVNKDRYCFLYRSTGVAEMDERGEQKPTYSPATYIRAQFQSLGQDAIEQRERILEVTTTRRVYLYADSDPRERPWAMWRPLARSGDYLVDDSGNYWYLDAVLEDFSDGGWISAQVTLQTSKPKLNIKGNCDGCSC